MEQRKLGFKRRLPVKKRYQERVDGIYRAHNFIFYFIILFGNELAEVI